MKKLTILLAATLFSLISHSQKLDNEIYFRFGYSNPSWSQYGLDKDFWGDETKKYGGQFEFGSIFMIQSLPAAENMALGINVDYLYTNLNNISNESEGINLVSFRAGSKIGPSFTYSPVDKMAIDVFVKADLAWATVAVPYEYRLNDADDYFSDFAAVGLSTGINFRYGILMLGFEINTISPELESDDYPGEYLQELLDFEFSEGDNGKKSKLPCVNFTIGMSF